MLANTHRYSSLDGNLQNRGDTILRSLGIEPAQAIALFYRQIVVENGLPFKASLPNKETVQAIQSLKNPETRKTLTCFSSVDEMMADLND